MERLFCWPANVVMKNVIDSERIESLLADERLPGEAEVGRVLDRAASVGGLDLDDAAILIRAGRKKRFAKEIMSAAGKIKERVFGRRVVLFAPLYLTNDCINNCLYCGFRKDNGEALRSTLSIGEAVAEAGRLEKMGFNRILLVAGESPKNSSVDRIIEMVRSIYDGTGIRIVHVNAAPMPVADLTRHKSAGVGVFQIFQETYHEETYGRMHPSGPKSDYRKRLHALDRAMEAGFDDVGMGALFGLYDWKYEVLSVISHARHLFESFGSWPHTISVPRLQPAVGSPLKSPPQPVSDEEFKLIVAVFRLAVPAAGIVVTTREPAGLRDEVLEIGVSQISAGSRTDPGGYSRKGERFDASQFRTSDHRSLEEMVEHIAETGNLPSLCTSCYRVGRTGKVFTEKASRGEMERFCLPNALLTLKEYVLDHANGSRSICEAVIEGNLERIEDEVLRRATAERLRRIEEGKRDLFF